jgi:hypothetical protein
VLLERAKEGSDEKYKSENQRSARKESHGEYPDVAL